MKIKQGWIIAGVAVLTSAIWLFYSNDLGLTGFDILMAGCSDVEELRTNTKAVADAFLAQPKANLIGDFNGKYELALDYSKSAKIRSLGFRSSFYYYCWVVYLPYSLRANSHDVGTVVVKLSDGIPDYRHDPKKFSATGAVLLDNQGKVITRTE